MQGNIMGRSMLVGLVAVACTGEGIVCASEGSPGEAPVVRVVAPSRGIFVLPSNGPDLLVAVEVVDVSGTGVKSDVSGVPLFVEVDENIKVFREGIISHAFFTNSNGQSVTEVVSRIPVGRLSRRRDRRITAPVDFTKLTAKQQEEGFDVPPDGVVEFATIDFVVTSRSGVNSPAPEDYTVPSRLIVGFAPSVYVPPPDQD